MSPARARSLVDAHPGSLRWRGEPPVALRRTGADRLHLVQAGGGPLGGDDLQLRLRLAARARLAVHSAAATVVQPGTDHTPASWSLLADVGAHAGLIYRPEPTIVCDQASLHSHAHIRLSAGAWVLLREQVVLGRYGERGGHYRGDLRVDVECEPILAHSTVLDGADASLSGPGGSGGARVFGSLLLAGAARFAPGPDPVGETDGTRWAVTPLAGPGILVLALGGTGPRVTALLDHFETALLTMISQYTGSTAR
jgi:urease accessory protein